MKTYVTILIALSGLFIACEEGYEGENGSGEYNYQAIRDTILMHSQVVTKGINTNDLDIIFRDYHRSDSSTFIMNGDLMEDFDEILENFRLGRESIKRMDLNITEEKVRVLGPDAAMHIAVFDQQTTNMQDSVLEFEGAWTAVYQKIDGKWQVIHVQESLVPKNKME